MSDFSNRFCEAVYYLSQQYIDTLRHESGHPKPTLKL